MLDTAPGGEYIEEDCGDMPEMKSWNIINAHKIQPTIARIGLCRRGAEALQRMVYASAKEGDLVTVPTGDAHMKRSNVFALGIDAGMR